MPETSARGRKAINIDWDVDDEKDRALLPTEIEIPAGMEDKEDISDYLSNITGFCHNGYEFVEYETDHEKSDSLLEREELLEMNCLVYDEDDNVRYEVFFRVKSGWLQEYFGVDNRCQLEALWDVSDTWEDPENFTDALADAEYSGIQIEALVRDNVKVEWDAIGEGLHGDYDPADPEDVELLRFYISVLRDGVWMEKEDASYCTRLPVAASAEEQIAGLEILLDQFHCALSANIDISVKKLGEQMSWIDLDRVSEYLAVRKLPEQNQQGNAADNLIKAMIAYGQERSWSDGEIVHALTRLGITDDDFYHAGVQALMKEYLESQNEQLIKDIKEQILERKNTTSYGEPQAWVPLSNGRAIEVTLEQEGLAESEHFYSVRLHCSEAEYENKDYHRTNGVIDQYSSSGSALEEVDKLVLSAISCNQKYPIAQHNIETGQETDGSLQVATGELSLKANPKTPVSQTVQYGIDDGWMHRGQKVKVLDKHFEGQIGTVHSFMWNTGDYIVTMENGHNLPFQPSELEMVDDRNLSLDEKKTLLKDQIQSAAIRAAEPRDATHVKTKEPEI